MDTLAGGVADELIAAAALAVEAGGGVDAALGTAAVVGGALVSAALVLRFVLPLRAVGIAVADLGEGNAGAATAIELLLRVAFGHWRL